MIKINNVNHFFNKKQILNDFSLNINSNSVTSILGPSGSGKTTLLRLISGLENLQSGNIQIDNNNDISSSKINNQMNNVSFVFQDSALFPHLTVIENIYYGLSKLDNNKNKIDSLIHDYNINKIKFSYPHQLSSGQKQLVALIRGLASNPKIILLDEPFANLDTRLREKLRDKVLHILKDNNITSIIVTHDADEAMFLSDYIAILQDGQIQQHGKPVELYTRPKNRFVANFLGECNFFTLDSGKKISIRPECLRISGDNKNDRNSFQVDVEDVVFHGRMIKLIGNYNEQEIIASISPLEYELESTHKEKIYLTYDNKSLMNI